MKKVFKLIYNFIYYKLPSLFYQLISGLKPNFTNILVGKIIIYKKKKLVCLLTKKQNGKLIIGNNFKCLNKVKSNGLGLIQPCIFNVSTESSKIIIGNNVGISGSSIKATTTVIIEDNVIIGTGCIITDSDSHPLHWEDRLYNNNNKIAKAQITIKKNAFIGARSIILKGVTIGEGAVVGAGSVVSKDVPPFSVVCGNPAKIVKTL